MAYGGLSGAGGGDQLDVVALYPTRFKLDVGFLSGDRTLYKQGAYLLGWSLREASGAAAAIELRDGTDDNGGIGTSISFTANASDAIWLGEIGMPFLSGVHGHVVTGAVVGALWLAYLYRT